jgi:hypothetical protein
MMSALTQWQRQFFDQQQALFDKQREEDRQERREQLMVRVAKDRKDDAEKRYKHAEKRLKVFEPGDTVDAWCANFWDTVDINKLDRVQALTLFFAKIPTDSTWISEFRAADKKRGEQVVDVDRWIRRLKRTYAQSHDSKLMVLRNIRQEENEEADAFVHRYRHKARSVGTDWSVAEIINRMKESVHPKWKKAYAVMSKNCKDYPDCISALSQAMSDEMDDFRFTLSMAADVKRMRAAAGMDSASVDATVSVETRSPAQSTWSRRSRSRSPAEGNASLSGTWNMELSEQSDRRTGGSDRRTCYDCGLTGHIRPDCPFRGYDVSELQAVLEQKQSASKE